jgi:hypothetical protein
MMLRVHYRDLKSFPFYISTVNTGAMTMKMMLDYLMWNRTTDPQGPLSVYSEQTLFNTYKGTDNIINGSELCAGLNAEIDDYHHGWIYGYFFAPSARALSSDALKDIVIWVDYNVSSSNDIRDVDVPKPGHPWHVPVAVPTGGNYNSWMVVRGIHTDKNAWNGNQIVSGPITIYGFWLNDPSSSNGNNIYVTTSYFTSTYFLKLNVQNDLYNNSFLVITDPDPNRPIDDTHLQLVPRNPAGFIVGEKQIIQNAKKTPSLQAQADTIIGKKAQEFVKNVVAYDSVYSGLTQTTVIGKPVLKGTQYIVTLLGNDGRTTVRVYLDSKTGTGQQFVIS